MPLVFDTSCSLVSWNIMKRDAENYFRSTVFVNKEKSRPENISNDHDCIILYHTCNLQKDLTLKNSFGYSSKWILFITYNIKKWIIYVNKYLYNIYIKFKNIKVKFSACLISCITWDSIGTYNCKRDCSISRNTWRRVRSSNRSTVRRKLT